MVRAKFKVQSVERSADPSVERGTDHGRVRLEAVTSGSPENESFFRWTPAGTIDLQIVNLAALDQFTEGQEVFVDFTPAE